MNRMHSVFVLLAAAATTTGQPAVVGTEDIEIQFAPRSPDQITSFYEARGFPEEMLDTLGRQCFITVRIHNTSRKKIWLDLASWQFSHDGRPLVREHRNHWLDKWKAMNMPQASISTFRWTLLPETLDYLPDEEEGGNIILPRVQGNITVRTAFATGDDRQGDVIRIEYDRLYCAENTE